jgi:hypothetical protein
MVVAIPSIGGILVLLLLAYLLLAAPVGSTRGLLITLINVLLIGVIIYLVLGLFQVV